MKYLSIFLFLFFFINAHASDNEKIVLVSGIDFERTYKCGSQDCPPSEYMMQDFEQIINDELDKAKIRADIFSFKWSRDMVSHGEDLKNNFNDWFYDEVCPTTRKCTVSFIAHSWGTVILTDFLGSLPVNDVEIRTVVTYGSPVTGAQIKFGVEPFWKTGIDRVLNNKSSASWFNIVNQGDPVAWDYPGVLNLDATGYAVSNKGRLNETFPVNNSQMDPAYLGTSIIRAINNKGSEAAKVIIKSWSEGEGIDLSNHDTSKYNPRLIAQRVVHAMPRQGNYGCLIDFLDIEDVSNESKKGAIYDLCKKGIVTGFGNNENKNISVYLKPSENINRAAFSKIITHNFIKKPCTKNPFLDVPENSWFCSSVKSLVEAEIVSGYGSPAKQEGKCPQEGGEKYFCPENLINYAELSKLILVPTLLLDTDKMTNVPGGEPWYKNYIDCANSLELFDKDIGPFSIAYLPRNLASREDAFFALWKAIKYRGSELPSSCITNY